MSRGGRRGVRGGRRSGPAASGIADGLAAALINPLALTVLVLSLIGLLVSAKSLQLGDAVPVIAVTSVTANTVTIAAGPIIFGDPLPGDSLGLIARLLAFALVIGGAALTPTPLRATEMDEKLGAVF